MHINLTNPNIRHESNTLTLSDKELDFVIVPISGNKRNEETRMFCLCVCVCTAEKNELVSLCSDLYVKCD